MPPERAVHSTSRRSGFVVVLVAAVIVLLPYCRLLLRDGNLTRPIRFGRHFAARVVPAIKAQPHVTVEGDGFDGQFYAQLATDPLLRRAETPAAMDDPAIRARRILTPALAWLAGMGRPAAILWTYPLLNLAAWLGLGVLAWRALPPNEPWRSAAFLAVVLGPGAIESASRCLPDLPAFVLAWLGVTIGSLSGRISLAGAVLGRETMLLAWIATWRRVRPWSAQASGWLSSAAVVALPLAAWTVWLRFHVAGAGRVDGQNLGWPLVGVAGKLADAWSQLHEPHGAWWRNPGLQNLVLVTSVLVQTVYLVTRVRLADTLWRWGIATALLALCLSSATWEAFYTVTRHLLPLHVAFNVLLSTDARRRWAWFIAGNLYVLPRLLFWLGYPA
jgi:hypothetical protein